MSRREELIQELTSIFGTNFSITRGTVVPTVNDVALDNVAIDIDAAILFIDIKGSTHIVNAIQRETAAKLYKAFLKGVTRIARHNEGHIRSFNGDGVLIFFAGVGKCDSAVKSAMEMKHFLTEDLMPHFNRIKSQNQQLSSMHFDFGIGITTGDILVIKGGIGGENNRDLVWVAKETNHAVKLAEQSNGNYHIHISSGVFSQLSDGNKYKTTPAFANPLVSVLKLRTELWESSLPPISMGLMPLVYKTSYLLNIE